MKSYTINKPEGYQKVPLPMRDEWVKALRSGEYPQGKDFLCYEGSYCCLGVLSKIQGRLIDGHDDAEHTELAPSNPLYGVLSYAGRLPFGVTVQFESGVRGALAYLNDDGLPFPDIADIIEELYCEPTP